MTSGHTLSRSTVLVLMLVSIHHLTWNIKKDIGSPVRQWSGFGILTHQTIQIAEPIVSPLQASIEQLEGLPPALVINGEWCTMRWRRSICSEAIRGRCQGYCSSISWYYSWFCNVECNYRWSGTEGSDRTSFPYAKKDIVNLNRINSNWCNNSNNRLKY